VHAVADVHDTPFSAPRLAPLRGLRVLWILQLVPFQASANVTSIVAGLAKLPTVVHAILDEHDTPLRVMLVAPAGSGVSSILQRSPLKRFASATPVPVLSV
jgi:hypothetical protein